MPTARPAPDDSTEEIVGTPPGPSISGGEQNPQPRERKLLERHGSSFIPQGVKGDMKWDHLMYGVYKQHGLSTVDSSPGGKGGKRRAWFMRRWLQALAAQKPEKQYRLFAVLILATSLAGWMGFLYFLKGKAAAPRGDIFSIICVWLAALLVGELVSKFVHPLLGAILAGFILRFIPGIQPHMYINQGTGGNIRNMALVVVLLRAGLSLDLSTLSQLPLLCAMMCVLPLVAEAAGLAIVAAKLLYFTWSWAFMLGFLVSAVSPAVVVPIILPMAEAGYGVEKGIPSLVFAVAAVSNVLSIASFYVWHTIVFEDTTITGSIFRAPQELVMGFASGLALGALAIFVTPKKKLVIGHETNRQYKDFRRQSYKRTTVLLGLGLFGFFGYRQLNYNGSGAMTMFTMGLAVAMGWGRRRSGRVQGHLANIWIYVAQPLLFGIIGSSIDYKIFQPGFLWKAVVILLVGAGFRLVTTVLVSYLGKLNVRERIFLALAWIPKATVQAALAPVVLADVLRIIPKDHPMFQTYKLWGQHILAIGILAVLIDAPLGAILVGLTGPRLLSKKSDAAAEELATSQDTPSKVEAA